MSRSTGSGSKKSVTGRGVEIMWRHTLKNFNMHVHTKPETETWNGSGSLGFCCDKCIPTEDVTYIIVILMLHWILNLNLLSSCRSLIGLHFLTLKHPFQNEYNTRVSQIIGSLVLFSQIALIPFLLFNPKIVKKKTTDKLCVLYNFLV